MACRLVLAPAACLLALALLVLPLAAVAQNDIVGPQCTWLNDGGPNACTLSPVYMVANLATRVPNAFAKLTIQYAAHEIQCPTITDPAACNADASCRFADQAWESNTCVAKDFNYETTGDALVCPGSIIATIMPCVQAMNETDCAAAVANGGACTWDPTSQDCRANYTTNMTLAEQQAFSEAMSTHNASIYGDCADYKAYIDFMTACEISGLPAETEQQCDALDSTTCTWYALNDYGSCGYSAIVPLVKIFGLSTSDPIIADQFACSASGDQDSCAANGGNVTLAAAVFEAALAGNLAVDPDVNLIVDGTTNATAGDNATAAPVVVVTAMPTNKTTGGAAAARAAPAALAGALLLGALLL